MEDLHKRWSHRWITPKAKVGNSKIQGLGVMAIENIKQGETVAVLGGIIVPASEIKEYWKILSPVGIQISEDFFIVPSSREELEKTGVLNHSCEPNIGYGNTITFISLRDIKKGEELVFDYAFGEEKIAPFKCNCGSKSCRKIIRPTDWQNKNIQKKYFQYFSTYAKEKIKRGLN